MKVFQSFLRPGALSLCLFALSCTTDTEDGGNPPKNYKPSAGTFQVSLIAPTDISQGYSAVLGKVYNGASPSPLNLKETAVSGECKLFTPVNPLCVPGCGSNAVCVETNVCKDYPRSIGVGKVTMTGLKTKAGATTFAMDPLLNSYQPPGGVIVDFPPFAEGDVVTLSAAGDTAQAAFTVTAKGISPLVILGDSLVLADGKSLDLKWTAPGIAGNTAITALIDISHHGGTKGLIECKAADDGSLEVAAALVDQLKALGISGFPKIDVSRKATGTNQDVHVDLVLESKVTKSLVIPGLISCSGNEECPDGQTCQADMKCK